MRFRGRFSFPKLDAEKYTKKLEEECQAAVKTAAKEWLRAVIPRVPVYEGTARGSLMPLGRFLRVAVPTVPVVKKIRNGRGAEAGAAKGSFKFETRDGRFIFSATTDVEHFIHNNFYEAPNPPFRLKNPTPWHAFEAGDEAFKRYLEEQLPKRIPKIKNFITYKTLVIE